jgi:uncharacterized FlaG/YvyC family protein
MITKLVSSQNLGASPADASAAQPGQDQTAHSGEAPKASASVEKTAPAEPAPQSLLRLEIATDRHGGFVYTLTDRDTGRVVAQIPRESVEQLGSDPNYTAGTVVKTEA